ncbi:MAG: bifunctional phosphopantothenoylcysteine decarboxylase/phosphopantothenate--cysteine ligase CoaBC [candidate division WOR-3 bacterium]
MEKVEVLLGVTGSIAAYKALDLLRLFKKTGWNVTVVMTRSATQLVTPESFRALSGRAVAFELFPKERVSSAGVEHIELATQPDLIVVAPATANIIGKLAAGIADDLLSTLLLAVPQKKVTAGRVVLAPAMNSNMWCNPIVQANISRLTELGYRFIQPETGALACGETGVGRMAPPETILYFCRAVLGKLPDLRGIPVLITTGRTEESIDPVRVVTNRSSGLMGVEVARAFAAAGAETTVVAGAVSVTLPENVIRVRTTAEMAEVVLKLLPKVKILVMCAAVADYQPSSVGKAKYHQEEVTLTLKRTPDILTEVAKVPHRPILIGFSQDDSLAHARMKLRAKSLDLIIANPFATAGSEQIKPTLIYRSGKTKHLPQMPKTDFAFELVRIVAGILRKKGEK